MVRSLGYSILVSGLVLAAVELSCAATLTPLQLRNERASSVVFLRDANTDKYKGLGVLVSNDGHVLTAKHVYKLFDGAKMKGSVGAFAAEGKVLKWIADVPSPADITLLQFVERPEGSPAPMVISSRDFIHGSTLRILTGILGLGGPRPPATAGQEDIANIKADISANAGGGYWQLSGAINIGDSGSPAFDLAGNLVGLVSSGGVDTGKFNILALDSFLGWLKGQSVTVQPSRKTDRILFYIPKTIEASPETSRAFMTFRTALFTNLINMARAHLPVKPFPLQWDKQPPLERLAVYLSDPPNALREIKDYVANNKEAGDYFRKFNAGTIFVVILDVQNLGQSAAVIKPFLVELLIDEDITVQEVHMDMDTVQATSMELTELFEPLRDLFRQLVLSEPMRFGANNVVFADCVNATWSWDAAGTAMMLLSDELKERWQKTEFRRYQIKSANPLVCDGILLEKSMNQSDRAIKEFAQHMLSASFSAEGTNYSVRWYVQSRDKKPGTNHFVGHVPLQHKPVGDMNPALGILAEQLTNDWKRRGVQ